MAHRKLRAVAFGVLVLIGNPACDDAEPEAVPPAVEEPAPTGPTEVEMVALMEGHYSAAIASHDALIRGDVETLRTRLTELADRPLPPTVPESWRPHERRLQEAARTAAGVSNLDDAAPAMGSVAEACGGCHVAVELGEIYRRPEAPEGADELETAMLGHQWATERLWEGITGPLDDAWNRGADALVETQVFSGDDAEPVSSALRARETELRELGRTARSTTGLHERAQVYGRLLATCAACHREAGAVLPRGE